MAIRILPFIIKNSKSKFPVEAQSGLYLRRGTERTYFDNDAFPNLTPEVGRAEK